jgi:hypothetical protein
MANRHNEEVPILEENVEREKGEDPLQFPEDPRPEWAKEDIEIEGRKPDMEETEEDTSEL